MKSYREFWESLILITFAIALPAVCVLLLLAIFLSG